MNEIESVSGIVKSFLEKIAGPSAKEVGMLFQDKVRLHRFKNQTRMLGKAHSMLISAGIEPSTIPLKTLLPLLEGASLEENEELSTKWAALLANAANLEESKQIHPSFMQILGQLSFQDAKLLDDIYPYIVASSHNWFFKVLNGNELIIRCVTEDEKSFSILTMAAEEFEMTWDNLSRLGICRMDNNSSQLSFTTFGYEFIKACQPPT